jgi:PEP-CTERM motif-containing protein
MRKSIGFLPALALGLAGAIVSIGPGRAAVITYILSTKGTGFLGGVAFTDQTVALVMRNDTTNVVEHPPAMGQNTFTNTGTMTVFVTGLPSETFAAPRMIVGVQQFPRDGFLPGVTFNEGNTLILGDFSKRFSTYDLKKNVGTIEGTALGSFGVAFPTSKGFFVLESALGGISEFKAEGALGEAVPEPSSWMLLAIGFAGLGLLHRRGLLRGSAAGRG